MVTDDAFRMTCSRFATGVAIATVEAEGGALHGMTINSFTSVSMDPPLILICVEHGCNLLPIFSRSGRYGLSVLRRSQEALSVRFAIRGHDRFDGVESVAGRTGIRLIPGALAYFECSVREMVEAGDHTVVIGTVDHCEAHEGEPLLFFDSAYRRMYP